MAAHPWPPPSQAVVSKLRVNQGVFFEQDPHNPYDPHAVRVCTLSGEHLGYVPRDFTHHMKREFSFGAVRSMGTAAGTNPPLVGASVCAHNTVPGMEMEVLPPAMAEAAEEVRIRVCLLGGCAFTTGGD